MTQDISTTDYSRYLILYSGGADSTYLLLKSESAKHLLHFQGFNLEKTKIAMANATRFNRYFNIATDLPQPPDGEINQFHALIDTQMALSASITAISYGMQGIVLGFNRDDLGINIEALTDIVKSVEPTFEILTPLVDLGSEEIRKELRAAGIPYVSCMVSSECGNCPKCRRGY